MAVEARVHRWLVGAFAVLAFCAGARGQSGITTYGIFGADARPAIARGELDVFVRVLELKDDERAAMYSLYDGFVEAMRREAIVVRDVCSQAAEEAEAAHNKKLLEPAWARVEEYRKWSEAMERSFVDDLKTLLTREQEQRWPIVERELRRMKRIGKGRISGESVDLVRMVDSWPADRRAIAGIAEILEAYSNDLDRAIVARDGAVDEGAGEFHEMVTSDPPGAEAHFVRVLHARIAIRELNFRFARQLGEALSEALGDADRVKFEDEVFAKAYPRLMYETRAQRFIDRAAKIEDLSSAQRREIDVLLSGYERDIKAWRFRAAPVLRDEEEAARPDELLRAMGKGPPADYRGYSQADHSNEPFPSVRRERLVMEKSTRAKVEAVLSEAQRQSIEQDPQVNAKFEDYTPGGP